MNGGIMKLIKSDNPIAILFRPVESVEFDTEFSGGV